MIEYNWSFKPVRASSDTSLNPDPNRIPALTGEKERKSSENKETRSSADKGRQRRKRFEHRTQSMTVSSLKDCYED